MSIPVEIVGGGIDLPAWVQAVGSVAAIVAAIVILQLQRRHAQDDRRTEERQFIFLALGLSGQAADLARDSQAGLEQNQVQIDPENFSDVIETMDKLPFDRMPTAQFVLAYVNVRRGLRFYGEAYRAAVLHGADDVGGQRPGNIDTILFNSAASIRLQHERLKDEAALLGVRLGIREDSEIYRAIRAHNPGGTGPT